MGTWIGGGGDRPHLASIEPNVLMNRRPKSPDCFESGVFIGVCRAVGLLTGGEREEEQRGEGEREGEGGGGEGGG